MDLLVLMEGQVRCVVEIEESGFHPTKICGKFLQACLADHFIHDTQEKGPVPYGEDVLFLQVLDGAACLKSGISRKREQAELIEMEIKRLLPLRGVTAYRLVFVHGANDRAGLDKVGEIAARCCLPAGNEIGAGNG